MAGAVKVVGCPAAVPARTMCAQGLEMNAPTLVAGELSVRSQSRTPALKTRAAQALTQHAWPAGAALRVGIVSTRWNVAVVDALVAG